MLKINKEFLITFGILWFSITAIVSFILGFIAFMIYVVGMNSGVAYLLVSTVLSGIAAIFFYPTLWGWLDGKKTKS